MENSQNQSPAVSIYGPGPWSERYTYVPAVRVGDLVFISGTTGTDENNQIVAPGDIVAQTRQIYQKFDRMLRSLGASCENIVQTVDHITTTENYKATAAVRREFIKHSNTTATGVIVAGLLREGAVIEITAIAALPRIGT
jgi:enamine deaminase RidA (YjgF/YER057c/UK114 family)